MWQAQLRMTMDPNRAVPGCKIMLDVWEAGSWWVQSSRIDSERGDPGCTCFKVTHRRCMRESEEDPPLHEQGRAMMSFNIRQASCVYHDCSS